MRKVVVFSALLVAGLVASQWLPALAGGAYGHVAWLVHLATHVSLAFLMFHVGREFIIVKAALRLYAKDYVVAMVAAGLPWLLAAGYFLVVMLPSGALGRWEAWKAALLVGRFASPTSAGILFAMLAAAGLGRTWVYGKARILAIFDDLDTVLFMIPLQAFIIGLVWELGVVLAVIAVQLWAAWTFFHRLRIPTRWFWVLGYSALIALVSEATRLLGDVVEAEAPIQVEVLLPAFVLGCMARHTEGDDSPAALRVQKIEERVSTLNSALFVALVGLSMPPMLAGLAPAAGGEGPAAPAAALFGGGPIGWGETVLHVLLLTILINLGKLVLAFCYRYEAGWRERLALGVAMCPRGEVGGGVLIISLGYGFGGPLVTVGMLCLVLNLVLTGAFIAAVKALLARADGTQGNTRSA